MPGPVLPGGFDFTGHVRRLCDEIVARLPELSHVDMRRVAVRFCQVRAAGHHGVHASLTPLRFAGGATTTVRRGRRWTVQRLVHPDGTEMLYLLSFYLPRFQDRPLLDKLATVVHELWHIGPAFDGDLRRHEGRCYAHGPREAEYHRQMEQLARRWLETKPPDDCYEFLRHDFQGLRRQHGAIYGTRIRTPRLVRVDD